MGGGSVPFTAHKSSGATEFSGLELDCNDIADIPNEAYAPMGARTKGRPVVSNKYTVWSLSLIHI